MPLRGQRVSYPIFNPLNLIIMAKLFIYGNTLYLPIDSSTSRISPKYVQASIGGTIYSNDIMTEEEVLMECPNAKVIDSHKSMADIAEHWGK